MLSLLAFTEQASGFTKPAEDPFNLVIYIMVKSPFGGKKTQIVAARDPERHIRHIANLFSLSHTGSGSILPLLMY